MPDGDGMSSVVVYVFVSVSLVPHIRQCIGCQLLSCTFVQCCICDFSFLLIFNRNAVTYGFCLKK